MGTTGKLKILALEGIGATSHKDPLSPELYKKRREWPLRGNDIGGWGGGRGPAMKGQAF